jgi:hypothetical protein
MEIGGNIIEISEITTKRINRWIALWTATEVAKARSVHSYWPNQTKEVIYNAQKVLDWLNGDEPASIQFIDDSDDSPEDLREI